MNTREIIIKEIRKIAEGVTELIFNRPPEFEFKAGQYTQFTLPKLAYPDTKGNSRVFTISSAPHEKEILSIAYRDSGSGYKKTLSELPVGSKVIIEEASGFFTLPKNGEHIFIAGGIGVTPFVSMIKESLKKEQSLNITLFYANRDKESSAYFEDLENLCAKSNSFIFCPIFERINIGHIQKHLKNTNLNWWIVGSNKMVADVKYLLTSSGISESNIRTEDFMGY